VTFLHFFRQNAALLLASCPQLQLSAFFRLSEYPYLYEFIATNNTATHGSGTLSAARRRCVDNTQQA
jgi:hypothetical protein